MATIFLAIPQYKMIPKAEIERIRNALIDDGNEQMRDWKPLFEGLHPAVDVSIQALYATGHHKIRHCVTKGDGNLPRARAIQLGVWRYRYETKARCDYFLTLDDDISFPPEAIDILIADDKPIIGGLYTFKTLNPDYIGKSASRIENSEVRDDGPFVVRWLNGGFILSRADALFKMIDAYPDLKMKMPTEQPDLPIKTTWGLWTPRIYEEELLSEDWAFSQRAKEIGIELWGELRTKLIHWDAEYGYSISLDGAEYNLNKIEGWMSEDELNWLGWKAKSMESIVELGSWKGRSTHALLTECKGTVYAVDHFRGDPESPIQQKEVETEDIYQTFIKNVGHFPNLKVLKMDSIEASKEMDSADMVFIDTEHTYERLTKELDVWIPKTKKLICGHDYDRHGIQQAVSEKLGEVKTFQTIWFKEMR